MLLAAQHRQRVRLPDLARTFAIKGDSLMENRTTVTPVLRPLHDTDVTTWELPEWHVSEIRKRITT